MFSVLHLLFLLQQLPWKTPITNPSQPLWHPGTSPWKSLSSSNSLSRVVSANSSGSSSKREPCCLACQYPLSSSCIRISPSTVGRWTLHHKPITDRHCTPWQTAHHFCLQNSWNGVKSVGYIREEAIRTTLVLQFASAQLITLRVFYLIQ